MGSGLLFELADDRSKAVKLTDRWPVWVGLLS
jgi:hypothetical protein